jgi:hypothetical protein
MEYDVEDCEKNNASRDLAKEGHGETERQRDLALDERESS